MAVIIKQESVTFDRTVKERTWRVELFTEIPHGELAEWSDYPVVIHRELADLTDPEPPGGEIYYSGQYWPRDKEIPADAGAPEDGTDGTEVTHYQNPVAPYFPRVHFTMHDIINATDDQGNGATVDLKDGAGNVVFPGFPTALIPAAIVAGIEYMVAKKYKEAVDEAIAKAVAEAIANQP